jgi:ferrous iron transport protein B
MGIREDNWVATVGIFTGVLAKEAVVGTLDALYGQLDMPLEVVEKPPFDLAESLKQAALTIPQNLSDVTNRLLDPLGLNIGALNDEQTSASKQNVNTATFKAMQHSFDGQAGAFAYLLFILLYSPCVAATAAIYRETSATWATFTAIWTTSLAYFTATLFYQIATFEAHPENTLLWVLTLGGIFLLVILILWQKGRHEAQMA